MQGSHLTWGSLISFRQLTGMEAQEETQGFLMRCEVSDDSIVVLKSWPVKAGNRLEDKTGMTCGLVRRVCA